jgi:hypothetical protein
MHQPVVEQLHDIRSYYVATIRFNRRVGSSGSVHVVALVRCGTDGSNDVTAVTNRNALNDAVARGEWKVDGNAIGVAPLTTASVLEKSHHIDVIRSWLQTATHQRVNSPSLFSPVARQNLSRFR